jgi:cysteinyl-tRNA synthetase
MNRAAFGEQIDIHGGGRDLIFPHHENEIAQTEALTGKPFVKYWTHNGLIKVNGQKMSKSLGNSLLLADLLEKYSDEAIKFALLQTNYRNDINITDDLFPDAEKHLREFYAVINAVDTVMNQFCGKELTVEGEDASRAMAYAEKIEAEFNGCMDDDFNTALALSNLFGYFKDIKKALNACNTADFITALAGVIQIRKTYGILGLFKKNAVEYLAWYDEKNASAIPAEVEAIAKERFEARQNRDWAKSDELRDKLASLGYSVKDSKTGYELIKNS